MKAKLVFLAVTLTALLLGVACDEATIPRELTAADYGKYCVLVIEESAQVEPEIAVMASLLRAGFKVSNDKDGFGNSGLPVLRCVMTVMPNESTMEPYRVYGKFIDENNMVIAAFNAKGNDFNTMAEAVVADLKTRLAAELVAGQPAMEKRVQVPEQPETPSSTGSGY